MTNGRRHTLLACLLIGLAAMFAAAPPADAKTSKPRKPATAVAARSTAANPGLKSAAVLVVDRSTNAILYSRHEGQVAPIASITKLMTALVVLDGQQPLDEVIEITPVDKGRTQGNASRLAVGTRLTRRELLHLALMSSENRAAQALGRSYPGGEPAFVRTMNLKARALEMQHSRFVDPTGLSEENVSTPNDLVRLVSAASKSALIRDFSTSTDATVKVQRQMVEFRNTNPLVRDPNWDISVQKTGHINAAGQCLVLQAKIDGRPVVIVLLNSQGKLTRVADARRIRQWMGAHHPNALTASVSP